MHKRYGPNMGYFIVDQDYQQIHGFGRYTSLYEACEDAFEYLLLSRHYPSRMPEKIIVLGIQAYSYVTDRPSNIMMILQPGSELIGWPEDCR